MYGSSVKNQSTKRAKHWHCLARQIRVLTNRCCYVKKMVNLCLKSSRLSLHKYYFYSHRATALKGQLPIQNNSAIKSALTNTPKQHFLVEETKHAKSSWQPQQMLEEYGEMIVDSESLRYMCICTRSQFLSWKLQFTSTSHVYSAHYTFLLSHQGQDS